MSVDSFKATAEQVVSQTAELTVSKVSAKAQAGGSARRGDFSASSWSPHAAQRLLQEHPRGAAQGALSDRRLLWEGLGGLGGTWPA